MVKIIIPIVALITIISGLLYWKNTNQPKTPLTWEECIKIPNAKMLLTYPGQCVTPNGQTVTQPLTEEEKKNLQPPDETANWKTYTSENLSISFKYPTAWDIRTQDDSLELYPVNQTQLEGRPPYDGHIFFHKIEKKETADLDSFMNEINSATGGQNMDVYKLLGEFPLDGKKALITKGGCCGASGKYVIVAYKSYIYLISLSGPSQEGYPFQNEAFFDQILSTFKFL